MSNNTELYSSGGHLSTAVSQKNPVSLRFRYFAGIQVLSRPPYRNNAQRFFPFFPHGPSFFGKSVEMRAEDSYSIAKAFRRRNRFMQPIFLWSSFRLFSAAALPAVGDMPYASYPKAGGWPCFRPRLPSVPAALRRHGGAVSTRAYVSESLCIPNSAIIRAPLCPSGTAGPIWQQ